MKRETNIKASTWMWRVPLFGNKHTKPYGGIKVTGVLSNGEEINGVYMTHGDLRSDWARHQYIIINKQRYIIKKCRLNVFS